MPTPEEPTLSPFGDLSSQDLSYVPRPPAEERPLPPPPSQQCPPIEEHASIGPLLHTGLLDVRAN
eukprot:121635-Pyramimonas_sp.AAC.1